MNPGLAAIHRALRAIKKEHEPLCQHLHNSLKVGEFLSYQPEQPTSWTEDQTSLPDLNHLRDLIDDPNATLLFVGRARWARTFSPA